MFGSPGNIQWTAVHQHQHNWLTSRGNSLKQFLLPAGEPQRRARGRLSAHKSDLPQHDYRGIISLCSRNCFVECVTSFFWCLLRLLFDGDDGYILEKGRKIATDVRTVRKLH